MMKMLLAAVIATASAGNPTATFDTTMGSFTAELYLDRVPRTASNFIDLAQSGFYDGLHFHRVIPGEQHAVVARTLRLLAPLRCNDAVHHL